MNQSMNGSLIREFGLLTGVYVLYVQGRISTPPAQEQYDDMVACRNAFTTQFVDRSQLRVMNGNLMGYYQDLAYEVMIIYSYGWDYVCDER